MKRTFTPFAALAAALLLATSAHAQTQTPAQSFAAAIAALNAPLGPTAEFRAPPAPGDAATTKSLSDIKTAMDALGTPAFPIDGANTFTAVCAPLTQIGLRYVLSGANDVPGFKENGQSSTPAMQALESANSTRYQDALMLFAAENTRCTALHLPWYSQMWAGLSDADRAARLDSTHQIRSGIAQMFINAAQSATQPAFSKPNRDLAITTAATYADTFASVLPVSERAQLLVQIAQIAPNLAADYPKEFATIVKALARTDCTGLCTAP